MTDRTCEKCNKVFDLPCRLKLHQSRKSSCALVVFQTTDNQKFKCKHCFRFFTTNSAMYRHIQKNCKMVNITNEHKNNLLLNTVQKQVIQLTNTVNELKKEKIENTKIISFQYIYLIYLREFINSEQNIYKIGKTKQINNKRFGQYPKGTIILYQGICTNCDKSEKDLISLFKIKYEHCKI